MKTFAEIWEQDGRWLLGPGLLGDVIEHMRGRAPTLTKDERNHSQANFTLPLPKVRDDVSGELRDVYCAIPPELQSIFLQQCSLIAKDWYCPEAARALQRYIGRAPMTQHTLDRINGELRDIERRREARGEEPELWEITANRFGFSRWALPTPAGLVRPA